LDKFPYKQKAVLFLTGYLLRFHHRRGIARDNAARESKFFASLQLPCETKMRQCTR